ncbi:MAG: hypothetical protein ACOYOJ_09485 [Alsobacter sp.]
MRAAAPALFTAVAVAVAWGLWLASGMVADWFPPAVAWPVFRLAVVMGGLGLLDAVWTRVRPPRLH